MIRLMIILFLALASSSFCSSKKDAEIVARTLSKIVNREKFEDTCYFDSVNILTIGYGTNYHNNKQSNIKNFCLRKIEELKNSIISRDYLNYKEDKNYKRINKDLLTVKNLYKKVKITKQDARFLATQHINSMLSNFKRKKVNGHIVYELLSNEQISELLSNAYNRGEGAFYSSDLWLIQIRNLILAKVNKKEIDFKLCLRILDSFTSQSKHREGIFNRRIKEANNFLQEHCEILDYKIYSQMANKYCKRCNI